MKRALLFIFLFSFSIIVKSQIAWCDSGATWHYNYYKFSEIGYNTFWFEKDTVVNSINCKKIKKHRYYYEQMFNYYNNQSLGNEIVYKQNNVVYIFNNYSNTFDTLYNINANIGDKWKMTKYASSSTCDSNIVTVTDTGTLIINSFPLRFLKVKLDLKKENITKYDTIIQNIGYLQTYFYPMENCIIDGSEGSNLRCYSDNKFGLYNRYGKNCDFIISHIEENSLSKINFYPNPANNLLHFENLPINEEVNYTIYALDGKIIQQGTISINQIDISSFENGVYFLKINVEGKSKTYKIVKTN